MHQAQQRLSNVTKCVCVCVCSGPVQSSSANDAG